LLAVHTKALYLIDDFDSFVVWDILAFIWGIAKDLFSNSGEEIFVVFPSSR